MFYLEKLEITNFRGYQNAQFEFNPQQNIFYGNNAVGKTSLVEAIYCLSFTKSFKNSKDRDLIRVGAPFYRIKGTFVNGENRDEVVLTYDMTDKRITKNQKTAKNISEYLGYFVCVDFSPDDLDLIKGSPQTKRKFIDANLGQIDSGYLNALMKSRKVLKERNEYLKTTEENKVDFAFLNVLTNLLVEQNRIIIAKRNDFIEALNTEVQIAFREITNGEESAKMVYNPNCTVDNLEKKAKERLSHDLYMQQTTWGTTRDDVLMYIEEQEAAGYASQGQMRSLCLAVKIGLMRLLDQKKIRTILILDDVFSELDIHRQKAILRQINKQKQTFITTTSISSVDEETKRTSKLWEMKRGEE